MSKMTEVVEANMATDIREVALEGQSVITFAVAEVEK